MHDTLRAMAWTSAQHTSFSHIQTHKNATIQCGSDCHPSLKHWAAPKFVVQGLEFVSNGQRVTETENPKLLHKPNFLQNIRTPTKVRPIHNRDQGNVQCS